MAAFDTGRRPLCGEVRRRGGSAVGGQGTATPDSGIGVASGTEVLGIMRFLYQCQCKSVPRMSVKSVPPWGIRRGGPLDQRGGDPCDFQVGVHGHPDDQAKQKQCSYNRQDALFAGHRR